MVDAALVGHLFRRAGFGLPLADVDRLTTGRSYRDLVDSLLVFDPSAVDVDDLIGLPGYVSTTARDRFQPNLDIGHARQRWLFRLVHARAPLREKIALVWHQHFATAYSKIQGTYGSADATRLMAAKASEDTASQQGQIDRLRDHALGSFRDLLIEMAKDPAMLVWLDGRTNVKARPQENFGRELMELFTFGVEHYTEEDVYAAARVFTGWNLSVTGRTGEGVAGFRFIYRPEQHDTGQKTFTFPIYWSRSGSGRTIPPRSASAGMQDGIDLIHALAYHRETALRLARRMWTWFVSETSPAPDRFVNDIARVYLDNGTHMRAVMRAVLLSPEFQDPARFHQRYAWPVEFVVRSLREMGHIGYSVTNALTPLVNMGQQLFEPPDVNGWELGPAWFSTGGMLARMNFAAELATNQRVALYRTARPRTTTAESLVDFATRALSVPPLSAQDYLTLVGYVNAGSTWVATDAQVLAKTAGVCHLLGASAEYQFV
jgi:uncharacterized protein (DUF1800 family)